MRTWLARLLGIARRGHNDAALQEEIDMHLALQAEEFERRGMSLAEASLTARAIARQGNGRTRAMPAVSPRKQVALYGMDDPVTSLDAAAKIRLLERIEQLARARDPRVKQVMASI